MFSYADTRGKSQKCLILVCNVNLVLGYVPCILTLVESPHYFNKEVGDRDKSRQSQEFPKKQFYIHCSPKVLWLKNVQSMYLQHFSCGFQL